jgi:hypothetical protein
LRHFDVLRENPARRSGIWRGVRIPGELDLDRFVDSVEILVSRHDALRIEVVDRPGEQPCQRILGLPSRADLISCQNVVARSEEQFNRYVRHIVAEENRQKWGVDTCHPYPFSFRLFRYKATVHVLVVGLSHMVVDGIGTDIVIRDLLRTYGDALAGRNPRGRPGRSFADSVMQLTAASALEPTRSAEPDSSDLFLATRFDVPRTNPREPGRQGRQASFSVSGTELAALRAQASLHDCTEFTWALAAFARAIFRFTGQDRIKVSVPVNLRGPAEREVVGMYVLRIPVVIERPKEAGNGRGFVAGVGSAVLRAMVRYRRDRTPPTEFRTDLSVAYQKFAGLSSRASRLGATHYMPQVDYLTPGISIEFLSYPVALDVSTVLDSAVFAEVSAKDVSDALRRNLTTDSDW